MRLSLVPHVAFPSNAVTGIEVDATVATPALLRLRYLVSGDTGNVRLPPPGNSQRADGLWQHTCFEAFLKSGTGGTYHEFNFAPSTQWAAYRFSGYREGMTPESRLAAPAIDLRRRDGLLETEAVLNLEGVSELAEAPAWRLGLAAVIEETAGRKSYWALAHPPGKPDFHHPDCFALALPAASPP